MLKPYDYTFLMDFIEKFVSQSFDQIDPLDPQIMEMERKLRHNKQFFYLADLLSMKILYVTQGCKQMIGVAPEEFELSSVLTRVHPSDFNRHSLTRSKLIKTGYELMMRRKGYALFSTHSRIKDISGGYSSYLFQAYVFFAEVPGPKVYVLLVLTDLSDFELNAHSYHYYAGDNMTMFRYPDEALLQEGHVFTNREFELIKLIAQGLGSEQIADKLSLSVNTINTHRRNILKKTMKSTTQELVIELKEKGII
jgi:DNA-binding CsgD family transcriptional regulator